MVNKLFIITLAVILVHVAYAQEPSPDFIRNISLKESKSFTQKYSFKENQNYHTWDLIYQRMNWKIDPAVRFISGEITSHFRSKTNELKEIEFDLHNDLLVDSVYYHAEKISFSHSEQKLNIPFEETIAENIVDSVTVFYHGIPPQESNFGSFAQTTHLTDPLVPIIWTLSEPYGAMDWWPCKQSLTDKIDSIDITVTSPEPYRTASNGVLVSETVENGSRTMHWKHRFPIATYLVAIAVTNYVDYTDTLQLDNGRHIEILNFVYPENLEKARSETPLTVEVMQQFNQLIGEYPFAAEKYGHAQFGWSGGMEHQTMSFMNNFGFELVAHELAHQWFGDYITLSSWHHIWLNEGFATYMTGLAYEKLLEGVYWPRWKKLNVERITSAPGGSVYVQDTTDVSRIFSGRLSYSKGGYLLHMLRWVLGDDQFFEGLRNYFNDPELAGGFASNDQFVQHMENAGDTTLTEFFNDWYYGEGFPIYSLEYTPASPGSYTVKLAQTTSHASVDFFEMPVPIRVYNAAKTDSADYRLVNTQNNQEFTIEADFEIDDIKIDPDYWLISQTSRVLKSPLLKTSENLTLFPNPAFDEITIQIPVNQKIKSVEIFTPSGNKVARYGEITSNLNVSLLPKGIYIFRISTEDRQFVRKVSKW